MEYNFKQATIATDQILLLVCVERPGTGLKWWLRSKQLFVT